MTKFYNLQQPLRFPSNRHFSSGISIPKAAGNSIFTIEKSLVQVDVDEINLGKAVKNGKVFTTSSGRQYGYHDDILYPISGEGIEQLSSQEYKLLKQYKNAPNQAKQTIERLVTKNIMDNDRAELIKQLAIIFGFIS